MLLHQLEVDKTFGIRDGRAALDNYQEEIALEVGAPGTFYKHFFGERFNLEDVRSFKPDVTIATRTELKIGGTRVELIPPERFRNEQIHLAKERVIRKLRVGCRSPFRGRLRNLLR